MSRRILLIRVHLKFLLYLIAYMYFVATCENLSCFVYLFIVFTIISASLDVPKIKGVVNYQ